MNSPNLKLRPHSLLRSLQYLIGLGVFSLLLGCKSPPPDLSRQKLIQVAVLLSYDHPAAYQNIEQGLKLAMGELSQINAVIFGRKPEPQLSRREKRLKARQKDAVKVSLKNDFLEHNAWKQQQIQQIIAQDFDVLVLFGDELMELDQSLLEAQQAGLLIVHCGYNSKPLISRNPLAAQAEPLQPYKNPRSPYDPPQRESPQHSILNESAERGQLLDEDYPGNPIDSGDSPLPYIGADTVLPDNPSELKQLLPGQKLQNSQERPGLVHINIHPASIAAMIRGFMQFLLSSDEPPDPDSANSLANSQQQARQLNQQGRRPASALLLFGPSELPFTRELYRQMSDSISQNRDAILAVRFLDPMRIDSQEQLRRLILQLPAGGRIVAMEPLLFYSSAQILQRYGLSMKIAGLGWEDLSDPLLASGSIQLLVPMEYSPLAYAALYAAFALYSGQKQGKSGEFFLLGSYGQRQVGPDGSLVLNNFYEIDQSQSTEPAQIPPKTYRRPSRIPQNPNRRSRLREYQ